MSIRRVPWLRSNTVPFMVLRAAYRRHNIRRGGWQAERSGTLQLYDVRFAVGDPLFRSHRPAWTCVTAVSRAHVIIRGSSC
jgi:hypothetical protein